jgi:hypothetical protein
MLSHFRAFPQVGLTRSYPRSAFKLLAAGYSMGMSYAQPLFKTYPGRINVESTLLVETLHALRDCAQACTICADACLAEENVQLAGCIRLNLDCSDICEVTSHVLSRQTDGDQEAVRALIEACGQMCRACADECARHGEEGMAHCEVCAEACRRGLAACERLLATVPA